SVQVNDRSAARWYKIDAVQHSVIETGTIADANLDLFYPSIAANDDGTVIIACNGSSAVTFISCYAVAGELSGGGLTFGDLTYLKAGLASYQMPDTAGISRWGDYSATMVDPSDPNRFWTIQAYPASATKWATQVTELITGAPAVSVTVTGTEIEIKWPI